MRKSFFLDHAFVSASTKDEPAAYDLVHGLEILNRMIWFAPKRIKPGMDIYQQIELGLKFSGKIIVLMSTGLFSSDWCQLERNTVLYGDLQTKRRRLIPVLLSDCEVPETLKLLKNIDARGGFTTAVIDEIDACL
jgi:hypothetical protein